MTSTLQAAFIERFREPNTPYLSPAKIGDVFGFQVQELAEALAPAPWIVSSHPRTAG